MQQQWRLYAEKYSKITSREQYLILFTGIIVFGLFIFNVFIDAKLEKLKQQNKQIKQTLSANRSTEKSIKMFEQALQQDPNAALAQQIRQFEKKLAQVDGDLLKLTSDLIDPIQMRHALVELLSMQKGVKLISFEVMPVEPLLSSTEVSNDVVESSSSDQQKALINDDSTPVSLGLYRHSIKLKLQGRYFQLRDYLLQLEQLSWTFFWQQFQYQLLEYPQSELEIEIYSLSTKREFIGV